MKQARRATNLIGGGGGVSCPLALPIALLMIWMLSTTFAEASGVIQTDIHYGPGQKQTLDVCVPLAEGRGPIPALVMIHGGAWQIGDKKDWDDICEMVAARGLVGVTINYRLADGTAANAWPAQLVDAQLAIRWVRSNAGQYGIDPAKICAIGDSAGGHLAVFLASLGGIADGDDADQLRDYSPKVNCAVDWFGPVDLSGDLERIPYMRKLFVGVMPDQYAQAEKKASPLFQVGPHTAPMLIVQGTEDTTVKPDQSEALAQALAHSNVPYQLWTYHGGHEFSGVKNQVPVYVDSALAFAKNPLTFLKESRSPLSP
jgi:acetyl esterase/lipase